MIYSGSWCAGTRSVIARERYIGRSLPWTGQSRKLVRSRGQALTSRSTPGDSVPPVGPHPLKAPRTLKAPQDLETRGFSMSLALCTPFAHRFALPGFPGESAANLCLCILRLAQPRTGKSPAFLRKPVVWKPGDPPVSLSTAVSHFQELVSPVSDISPGCGETP